MPLPLLPTAELDLTKVDRQGLLYRIQTLARQVIPQWGDFSLGHPENVLLEASAHICAMAIAVFNERYRQLSVATMTDRLAAIRKGRTTGYALTGTTAAQVSGVFTLVNNAVATKRTILQEGLRLQAGEAIYTLQAASAIEIGNSQSPVATVENAENQTASYQSDETANLVIQLPDQDIIDGSVEVTAGNGVYSAYNVQGVEYRSFIEVGPSDRALIVLIDNYGKANIYFGNGINGAIPLGTIQVGYKTGGGEDTRVAASAAWTILDGVYDSDGNAASVSFSNSAASVGGYNATTVDEARVRIPQAIRTLERCVNEEDYEYAATRVAGIATAAFITFNQDKTMSENIGYLYPVAYGAPYTDSGYYPPGTPTAAQLASITALIAENGAYPRSIGMVVSVLPPFFHTVVIQVKIYKHPNYTAAQVKANITQALQKFFAIADDNRALNDNMHFGYELLDSAGAADFKLAWSNIFNVINDAEGVREIPPTGNNLLVNGNLASAYLDAWEFPFLGTLTVYDMDSGGVQI